LAAVMTVLCAGASGGCAPATLAEPARPFAVVVVKPPTFAPSATTTAIARRVRVAETSDRSRHLARDVRVRVTGLVRRAIERAGHAIDGAPELVVSPSVVAIDVQRVPRLAVHCQVAVRVTPAAGANGERWEADRTATATASATATPGGAREDEIARSIEDCVATATEEAIARRVVPFLAR
jgi:hypothetical protein